LGEHKYAANTLFILSAQYFRVTPMELHGDDILTLEEFDITPGGNIFFIDDSNDNEYYDLRAHGEDNFIDPASPAQTNINVDREQVSSVITQ
jgi:hypothetical protein